MLDSLLRKGYFPQELPPLFGTESFADCISKNMATLPVQFTCNAAKWTNPVNHNLCRVGGLRRRLSIPNPINYFRLAKVFNDNQALLVSKWESSPYSQTSPVKVGKSYRAISPDFTDRAIARIKPRAGAKYLLKTDISQFYPSIYTHSIPWALHGKKVAKEKMKDKTLPGNIIDAELRAGYLGQTKGISIGPDCSLGIAELIMQDIDSKIQEECKPRGGVRFIDDMEFSFSTLAEAEHALAVIENLLFDYELQLNVNKTSIIELPDTIESAYISRLRTMLPVADKQSNSIWVDYFNEAFSLARDFPSEGVLRYAVSCIQGIPIDKKRWSLVESLLWQCIQSDPGVLRFVIDVIQINVKCLGYELNKTLATESISELILSSATTQHASEILWGLWASLLFKLELKKEAIEQSLLVSDPLVAIALNISKEVGLVKNELESDVWEEWFLEDSFYDSGWLFIYEAFKNNWMVDQLKNSNVDKNEVCQFLKNNDVSFINTNIIESYVPKRYEALSSGSGGRGY